MSHYQTGSMMKIITRRSFLKGLAATAAGLLVPSDELIAEANAVKMYWRLDRSMIQRSGVPTPVQQMEFLRPLLDPMTVQELRNQQNPYILTYENMIHKLSFVIPPPTRFVGEGGMVHTVFTLSEQDFNAIPSYAIAPVP